MEKQNIIRLSALVAVTLLVSLACSLTSPAATPEPPAITVPEPDTQTPPAPLPEATTETIMEDPAPEAAAAEPIGPEMKFSWLTVNIPAGVAASGQSEVIPPTGQSEEVAPWDVAPLHEEIMLEGYALADTFHKPVIRIYPVRDFIALEPALAERANTLEQIIRDQSADPGYVPLLPPWNAGQMFLAKPAYLEFKNGSGIRYLTQYGQSFAPINNQDLFYSFQGLTSDGNYWVSAILPVSHPSLQPSADNPMPSDFSEFAENFEQYITLIKANLDTQPEDTFTPSLAELDAMMQSMLVEPLGP